MDSRRQKVGPVLLQLDDLEGPTTGLFKSPLHLNDEALVSIMGKGQLGEAPGGLVIGEVNAPGQALAEMVRAILLAGLT